MTAAEWDIHGPTDFAWTPTEVAQIARAAQTFAEALASVGSGRTIHLVRLHGVGVLTSDTVLDWPQPDPFVDKIMELAGEQPVSAEALAAQIPRTGGKS